MKCAKVPRWNFELLVSELGGQTALLSDPALESHIHMHTQPHYGSVDKILAGRPPSYLPKILNCSSLGPMVSSLAEWNGSRGR